MAGHKPLLPRANLPRISEKKPNREKSDVDPPQPRKSTDEEGRSTSGEGKTESSDEKPQQSY